MAEAERQGDEDINLDTCTKQKFLRPSLQTLSSQGRHFFLNEYANENDSKEPPFLINISILIIQIVHICTLQFFNDSSILNNLDISSNKTHFILCLIALVLGNCSLLCITFFSNRRVQILSEEQLLLLFKLTIFSQTIFLVYYLYLIIWLQNLENANHSWIIYDIASLVMYYYSLRQSIVRFYFQDWFFFILIFGSLLFTFGKTDYFYYSLAELGVLVLTVLIPALAKSRNLIETPQNNQIKKKFRHIISDGPMSPEELYLTRQQIGLGINTQRSPKIKHQSKDKSKLNHKQDKNEENLFSVYAPHLQFQSNPILTSGKQNSLSSHQKYQLINISQSAEASNNCLSLPSRSKCFNDLESKLETYQKQTDGEEATKSNSPFIIENLTETRERPNSAYQEAVKAQDKGLQPSSSRHRYNSTGNNLKSPFKELQQQFFFPQTTTTTATTLNNHINTNTNIHYHHHQHEQSITIFQDCNVHFKVDEHDKKNEQIPQKEQNSHNEGESYNKKKSIDEALSPTPSMKINGKTMARRNSQKSEEFMTIKAHGDLLNINEEQDIFPWISFDDDCCILGYAGNPFDILIPLEGNKQQQQQQRFQNRQQTAKFEQIKRTTSTIKEIHEKKDQKERKPSESPEKELGSNENVQYFQKYIQHPFKDHARFSNADSESLQEKKINSPANFIQELSKLVDSTYVSLLEFYETSKKHELIQMFLKHDYQFIQLNQLKQKNSLHSNVVPSVGNLLETKPYMTSPVNSSSNNKDSQEDSQIQLSSRGAIQQSIKGSGIPLFGSSALQSFHKVSMNVLSVNPFYALNMSQNSFSIIRPEDQIPQNQQQPTEAPPLSLVKKTPSSINTLAPNQSCAKLDNSQKTTNHSPKNAIHTLIGIPSDLTELQQQQKEQEAAAKNRQTSHQQTQFLINTPPTLVLGRRHTQMSLNKIGNIQPVTLTNLNRMQAGNNNNNNNNTVVGAVVSQVINSSAINNNNNSNSIPQVSISSLRIESNQGKVQDEFVNNMFQFEKACNQNNLRVLISIILELEKENLTEQVIYRVLKCRNYSLVPKCPACQNFTGSVLHAASPNSKSPISRFLNHNQLNRKQSDQISGQNLSWNMDNIVIDIVINPKNRNTQSSGKSYSISSRKEKVRVLFRRDFTANFFEAIHTMHSSQEEQNRNKAEVLLVKKIFIDSFQSVSHEFGTALNCINNLSQAACNQLSQQSVDEIIKPIRYNSTLMQFLINDILDHHMILQNTFILDDQPFSLSELKNELIQLFYLQIEYKHLDLDIRINSHIPDVICADRNRIQSILMTMIRNAIKYTQKGGIVIEIKQKLNTQINNSSINNFILQLEVSDTGVGLDEYESTRLRQLLNSGFCNEPISKNSLGNGVGGLCVSNLIAIRLSGRANRGIQFTKNPYCNSQGTIFTFQVQCTQTLIQRRQSVLPSIKSRTNTVFLPYDSYHPVTFDGSAMNDWENSSGLAVSPMLDKQPSQVNQVYPSLAIHSMQKIKKNQEKIGELRIKIDQNNRKNNNQEQVGFEVLQDCKKQQSRDSLKISISDNQKPNFQEKRERSFSSRERVQSTPWQDYQLNPLEELNEPDDDDQEGDKLCSQSQIRTQLQQHTILQQQIFEKQINIVNKVIGSEHQAMGASLPIQLNNNQLHWPTHIAAQSVFIPYSSSITPSSQNNSNILPSLPLSSQRQQLQQQQAQQQSIIAGLVKSQRFENIQDEDFQVENLMTNLNFFREQGLRDSKELDNSLTINKNNPTINSPQIQALSSTLSPLWNFGGSKKSQFKNPRTSKNRFTFDSFSFQQLEQEHQEKQAHHLLRNHSYSINLPSRGNNPSGIDKLTSDTSAAADAEKNKKIANILKMADAAKPTGDVAETNQPQITESITTLEGEQHQKRLIIKPESSRHLNSLRPNSLLETNLGNIESPSVSPNFNLFGYSSSLGPQKFIDAFQFTLKEKDSTPTDVIHSPHRKLSNKSFMNRHSRVTFGGGNISNLDDEALKLDRPLSRSLESMHTEISNDQAIVSDNQIAVGNDGTGMILKGISSHEAVRHHMDINNSKQESSKFESTKPDTSKIESNKIETPKQGELSKNMDSPLARLIGSKKISLPNKSSNQEQQNSNLENQLSDNFLDKNSSQKPGTAKCYSNFQEEETNILADNPNNNPKVQLETSIPEKQCIDDPKLLGFNSVPQIEKQSTSSCLTSQCCVKILCVDDEPFNHFVIKAILAPRKLTFDTALNGNEAVTMFQQRKKCLQCGLSSYCLIFMDLNMPVQNGFEATQEIKDFIKLNRTNDATIITCSAFIDMASKSKAQQCGSDFFLQKPINSKLLFDFIDKHFTM